MEYWPLCAIISTNDRKEKSLAGVTAPWMGGCRADCEKRHRSVVCPCCEEERKPTSCSSARCMCVLSRGFFNDGPVTEGGPRLAPGFAFPTASKSSAGFKKEARKSFRSHSDSILWFECFTKAVNKTNDAFYF